MPETLFRVKKNIEREELFGPRDRILVAVSGGGDSMACLHLLKKLGGELGVAHCNFQLRPESIEEEKLVRRTCEDWNIPFHFRRFDTAAYADKHKVSTQMAARELRYAFFAEVMHTHSYQRCATAHHRDDQVETILLSLLKDQESPLFKGIPVKRGPYIRPLLCLPKSEILHYLRTHQIEWLEDASNKDSYYQRNQLRLQVLPLLREINPSIDEKLLDVADRYSDQYAWLQNQFEKASDWVEEKGNSRIFPLASFTALGDDFPIDEFFRWWLKKHLSLRNSYVLEVIALLDAPTGGHLETDVGTFWKDRNRLIYRPLSDPDQSIHVFEEEMGADPKLWNWGGKSIELAIIQAESGLFKDQKAGEYFLDAAAIQWPLHIRAWKEGDRMRPFGMQGQKKLSDIFVNQKIPLPEKSRTPVFEDSQQIICLSGFRIADSVKLTSRSQRILKIVIREE